MFSDFVGQKKTSFSNLIKQKRFSFQPLNTRQRSFERNKIAFNHNLSKKQCTQITISDLKNKNPTEQQQLDDIYKNKILSENAQSDQNSNRINQHQSNNIKVICKYKRSSSNERQIEIHQKEQSKIEVYDSKTFLEVECDHVFPHSQPSLNKEIWQIVKEGIEESYERKENYTLILHGATKTGKNQILLNKSLLNLHNSTMEIDEQIIDSNAGILERTVNHLLIKYGNSQHEVLISVIGFVDEKAIDLLNLEQDVQGSYFTLLKLKKNSKNIQIENLIQMGIRNIAEYVSIFIISDFLKKRIYEELNVKIRSVIYQVVVAKMSDDRENISSIVQKFNFVKMSNCQQTALQRTLLNYCIEKVASQSNQFTPYNDSKLTSFLQDTLTKTSVVQILPCITDTLTLKSQLPTLTIISSAKKIILNKKHYDHDPEILAKVYTQDILEVKDIVSQFENGDNIIIPKEDITNSNLELPYLANKQEVKKFLGVVKNNKNISEFKSPAMIETESFNLKKKVIRSNSQLVEYKEQINMSNTYVQNKENNNKSLHTINKSFHLSSNVSNGANNNSVNNSNTASLPHQKQFLDFSEQFKPFNQQLQYMTGNNFNSSRTNNFNNNSNLNNHPALKSKQSTSCEKTQQIYRKQYYKQNKIFLEPISVNDSSRRNTHSYRKSSQPKISDQD